jgi:FdhE protein
MAAGSGPRIVGGRVGDPTREAVGQPVPVILPVPSVLFLRRVERLESLAADHPMADWLRFMARLAHAQHDAVEALPAAGLVAVTEGESPLGYDRHRRNASWQMGLAVVLRTVDHAALPDQARGAIRARHVRDSAAVESLANSYLHGDMQKAESGEAVFVAAALAAYWTGYAGWRSGVPATCGEPVGDRRAVTGRS